MIEIGEKEAIYVACPAYSATGGTELLHQLVFKLRSAGFQSYIFYYNRKWYRRKLTHPRYHRYNVASVTAIKDSPNNVLIVPELSTDILYKYPRIRKAIWWLSIDNYYSHYGERRISQSYGSSTQRYFDLNSPNLYCNHLVQSEYAKQHLKSKGISSLYLSDYLNSTFISNLKVDTTPREDLVLYNPSKGLEFTVKLIEAAPELSWVPIRGLSEKEVSELLQRSKVYIDFGPHPGKDRFPREAALSGCCVITGLRGSAKYFSDVPIPSEFKFDETQVPIDDIILKIKDCIDRYQDYCPFFDDYRNIIRAEERRFEKDLAQIFQKGNSGSLDEKLTEK